MEFTAYARVASHFPVDSWAESSLATPPIFISPLQHAWRRGEMRELLTPPRPVMVIISPRRSSSTTPLPRADSPPRSPSPAPTRLENFETIDTIADGSCFYHALLNALYAPYQESEDDEERRETAASLRAEISRELARDGARLYKLVSDGALSEISEIGVLDKFGRGYDLKSVRERIENPSEFAEDYAISIAASALGVHIFIYEREGTEFRRIAHFRPLDRSSANPPRAVAILHSGEHFDLLARRAESGALTAIFSPEDLE